MADATLTVVDGRAVIQPFGAAFLSPLVELASGFADASEAWAEGTEPGGPGTKSAKGWAEDASDAAAAVLAVYGNVVPETIGPGLPYSETQTTVSTILFDRSNAQTAAVLDDVTFNVSAAGQAYAFIGELIDATTVRVHYRYGWTGVLGHKTVTAADFGCEGVELPDNWVVGVSGTVGRFSTRNGVGERFNTNAGSSLTLPSNVTTVDQTTIPLWTATIRRINVSEGLVAATEDIDRLEASVTAINFARVVEVGPGAQYIGEMITNSKVLWDAENRQDPAICESIRFYIGDAGNGIGNAFIGRYVDATTIEALYRWIGSGVTAGYFTVTAAQLGCDGVVLPQDWVVGWGQGTGGARAAKIDGAGLRWETAGGGAGGSNGIVMPETLTVAANGSIPAWDASVKRGTDAQGLDSLTTRVTALEARNPYRTPPRGFITVQVRGQSNGVGQADALSSIVIPSGYGYQLDRATGTLVSLEDPTGQYAEDGPGGSAWLAFADEILNLSGGEIGVILNNACKGGSTLIGNTAGWGNEDGTNRLQADADYAAMIAAASAMELPIVGMCGLWNQGESESEAVTLTSVYKNEFNTMAASWRGVCGSKMWIALCRTGYMPAKNISVIRKAQMELAVEEPQTLMAHTRAYEFYADGLLRVDNIHWQIAAQEEVGRAFARCIYPHALGVIPKGYSFHDGAV